MGKIPVILDVFAEHYFKRSQNLSPGWLVVCFPPRLAFLVLNFSRSARPQFEEKPVKIPYWRLACGRFLGSSRVVGTIKAWVFPENRPKSRHRKTFDDFFGVLRSLWQLT